MTTLQERIAKALSKVYHPRHGTDLVSAESVRDIATTTDGKVQLTLLLAAQDDPALAREVRHAVQAVEGVIDVRVNVKVPNGNFNARHDRASDATPRDAYAAVREAFGSLQRMLARHGDVVHGTRDHSTIRRNTVPDQVREP